MNELGEMYQISIWIMNMSKIIYVAIGSVFLSIGFIGIVIPGLPSTPFFIISAACYLRSSSRLYKWMINHRLFGKYIKMYYKHRAMTVRSKIISLLIMWTMISISVFIIENLIIKIVIVVVGLIGTIFIIKIKTYRKGD